MKYTCIYCKVELIKTPTNWTKCPQCDRNYNNKYEGLWFFAGSHSRKRVDDIHWFFFYLKTNNPNYIRDVIKYYRRLHPQIPENKVLKCFLVKEDQDKV